MIGIILAIVFLAYSHRISPAPIQKPKKAFAKKAIAKPSTLFFSSLTDKEADAFIEAYIRRNDLIKYSSFFQLKKELLLELDKSNPQISSKLFETDDWKGDLMENVRNRLKAVDLPNGEYYGIHNGDIMQLLDNDIQYYYSVRGFFCPTFFVVKNLRVVSEKGMNDGIDEKTPQIKAIKKRLTSRNK